MKTIGWDRTLTLGIKEIDDDHRDLVDCYNHLSQVISLGEGSPAIKAALKTLVDKTESHFQFEEALMESVGYPDCASHKAGHRVLLSSVMMLQKQMADGGQPVSTHRFSFLRSWVLDHILDTDKDLAQFILQLSVTGSSDGFSEEFELAMA